MRHSDVLVIGSGMAGLSAAIKAASLGAEVTVVSEGAGVLSIGSGAVDFLGYINGKKITDNPFNHLNELNDDHPYRVLGAEKIKEAFDFLVDVSTRNGYPVGISENGYNKTAISIAGTLKPTYICSKSNDASNLSAAKKILIAGVEYLKDTQPVLAVKQAGQSKFLSSCQIDSAYLKSPFGHTHRVLNSLDVARYVDKPEGFQWLKNELMRAASGYDAVIIPPICGTTNYLEVYKSLSGLGFTLIESVSIPPGVGGYRLKNALMKEARKYPIKFVENCNVQRANISGNKCVSVTAVHSSIAGAVETEYSADKFITATGGIIGGGIKSTPYAVEEAVFKIPLQAPDSVEGRSSADVFGSHKFARFGVKVSKELKAVDDKGKELFDNVYFAGNTLGGYDFPSEKSGYGVALSTGYNSALFALQGK